MYVCARLCTDSTTATDVSHRRLAVITTKSVLLTLVGTVIPGFCVVALSLLAFGENLANVAVFVVGLGTGAITYVIALLILAKK